MSDPAGPVQFSLGDLGGPFGKFSDHSERWTKRTTKTAWSNPEAVTVTPIAPALGGHRLVGCLKGTSVT